MGEPRSRLRAAFANGLLSTAILLTILPLITTTLPLFAGTFRVHDGPRPGPLRIGLSSLSIASFNGIIPSPSTPTYLIHFQYFPLAFTWSYPSSPSPNTTSGILSTGPTRRFDPFRLIQSVPTTLNLPAEESACLDPGPRDPGEEACTSPFWRGVYLNQARGFTVAFSGPLVYFGFILRVAAIVMITLALVAEACIRWRPYSMRCQCWWRWCRRMCPLPKGTREEIEGLDEHVWDGVRLWFYGLAVAYVTLPVLQDGLVGIALVRAMRYFDNWLPRGMSVEAETGRGLLVVGWGGVVVAAVAFLCVWGRWYLTKRNAWIDQQLEPLLGEGSQEDDALGAILAKTTAAGSVFRV